MQLQGIFFQSEFWRYLAYAHMQYQKSYLYVVNVVVSSSTWACVDTAGLG
jgi:hypothetical protein